jgi:hypothetical protein
LLKPLVVPCCMVAYPSTENSLFNIGCPFCFVTYKYPLMWGVLATYAAASALLLWGYLFQRSAAKTKLTQETAPLQKKFVKVAIVLAVVGTVLLVAQAVLGSFSPI